MTASTNGRPRGHESDRRRREMLRLLSEGVSFADATEQARVSLKRAAHFLDEPEFRAVLKASWLW